MLDVLASMIQVKARITYSAPSKKTPITANFCLVGICNCQTKGHGITIIMKSVTTPEGPRAALTVSILMHFDPGGFSDDTARGTHISRRAKKKLIIHAMTKPMAAQFTIENTLPLKILL